MTNLADLRISRDFKYTALYTALRFFETKKNIYAKEYSNCILLIEINEGFVNLDKITYIDDEERISHKFRLNSHKDFVILECIDKLLTMGYTPEEIIIQEDNEYDIYCKNLYIRCYEWGHIDSQDDISPKDNTFYSIRYESRLISGVIERNTKIIDFTKHEYEYGIFENDTKQNTYNLYNKKDIVCDKDFVVSGDKIISYKGIDKKVIIPEGIVELESSAFWDNQYIEEVILPDSLVNLGGDTFYNCKNLKKIIITKNVKEMGNNPFAGCPEIEITNESPFFKYIDYGLFTADMTQMIYYSIKHAAKEYKVPTTTKIICKHTFYLCNNLELVVLPRSLKKMENNPFSGCTKIKLDCKSSSYHVVDDVIYDKYYSSVCGCLTSIKTNCLKLKNVIKINRNSFWNCKGIKKIILPSTLEDIGYNPFVGCDNIEFVSESKYFIVEDGKLYNADMSKLICCPKKYAVGDVHIKDSVLKLERGAFSGCDLMTNINLHNVTVVSKSCFTNCNSLTYVYCSDLVTYIGEWSFGHCENLKEVSIYKDCFVDNNALSSTKASINIRNERSNYVIESDNKYTLNAMLSSYKGKFDSILIDPPYNSNIDGIGYKDHFNEIQYINDLTSKISTSLCLLSDTSFLVINIDEGGLKYIIKACNLRGYYEAKGNLKICKWKKLHPYFDKNRDVNSNKPVVEFEYIVILFKSKNSKFNNIMQPYLDGDSLKEKEAQFPEVFDCFGTTSSAKDEIKEIFGDRKAFSTPKPVKLMKELIRATTNKDSLIMDFYAGSGTIGQACIELNKEDGGNRKYILVSNNESNICKEITYKRMQMFDNNVNLLD